jgi:RNA polymerase sigma-70 factor, ECF subfamily
MISPRAVAGETHVTEFEAFFRENYGAVWRYVSRRAPRALTDDIVSRTFVIAWQKYATLSAPALPWLIRIARFEVSNARRKLNRESKNTVSLVMVEPAGFEERAFDGEAVRSAMAKLNEQDCEVLRLVLWDELPRRDIARVLGVSVNAVNVRFHRALQRFEHVFLTSSTFPAPKENPDVR